MIDGYPAPRRAAQGPAPRSPHRAPPRPGSSRRGRSRFLDAARLRRSSATGRTSEAGRVDRPDVPHRREPRSGPDRRGRPSLRLRPAAGDVSDAGAAAAAGRRSSATGRPAGADGGRILRVDDLRVHRARGGGTVLRAGSEPAAIANPLSEKFAVLRPSLLPGLVDSCAHNRRRGRKDVRLFESGSRFTRGRGRARGRAGMVRRRHGPHWSARRAARRLLRRERRRRS